MIFASKITKSRLFDSGALPVPGLNHLAKDSQEQKGTKVKKIAQIQAESLLNTKVQESSRNPKKSQEISRNIYIKNSRSSAPEAATGTSTNTSLRYLSAKGAFLLSVCFFFEARL